MDIPLLILTGHYNYNIIIIINYKSLVYMSKPSFKTQKKNSIGVDGEERGDFSKRRNRRCFELLETTNSLIFTNFV